jgi:hypothetical protein
MSGRGKIVSVTKDGLNDAYTFKTNQSSSLWDAKDQCKPAFFSVARVGINYSALDSLIAYADTLQESKYTAESWSNFAAALASAKIAKDQNYSASVSADTALIGALNSLNAAVDALVEVGTGIRALGGSNPKSFVLLQNYPNPFNPTTVIKFVVPSSGFLSLKVYDMLGREVRTLVNEVKKPGSYEVRFKGTGLPSGVYFYRIVAGQFTDVKKLVLVK